MNIAAANNQTYDVINNPMNVMKLVEFTRLWGNLLRRDSHL